MNRLVSIIIPIYNAERYLDRCIKSCITQTYDNIEILLVDDGSSDSSKDVAQRYKEQDNRIRCHQKQNSGVSDTRNMGIANARGEYLMFLDADDALQPDCCARLLEAMSEETDLVVCGYTTGIDSFLPQNAAYGRSEFAELIQSTSHCNCLYVCWNKLYRKDKILTDFPPNVSFGEDSMFVFQYLANCENVVTIDYVGYRYTVVGNAGSAMKKFHPNMLEMCIQEAKTIRNSLPEQTGIVEFSCNHLVQNLLYFVLPNLFKDHTISVYKRYRVIAKLTTNQEVQMAFLCYRPARRLHKLMKNAIFDQNTVLFFFVSWFLYG